MKKLLTVLLIFLLIISTSYAETIDLSSMTIEDLIVLHEQLDAMLEEKFSCQLDVIYPGNYIVGKDIKEGSYLFSCTKVGMANFWILTTYVSEDDFANRNSLARENLQAGNQAQINLTDGMVLSIGEGLGTIQTVNTPSWAP